MDKKRIRHFMKNRAIPFFLAFSCVCSLIGCGGKSGEKAGGEAALGTESPQTTGEGTSGEGGSGAKGRYMETAKTTPEGLKRLDRLVRLADGSLEAADISTGTVYISKDDGESWEKKETPVFTGVVETGQEIEVTSLALAPDGGMFFSYVNWANYGEEGNSEQFVYIDAGGQEQQVPIKPSSEDFHVEQAVFGDNGELYLEFLSSNIYKTDIATGEMEKVMASSDSLSLVSNGDYLVSTSLESMDIYQFSTGKTLDTDTVLNDFTSKEVAGTYSMGVFVDGEEGQVYTASASGLYSHVFAGNVMDKLLDGGLSSLGDPTKAVIALLKNQDGSFLVGYEDGEIDALTYDKDAPAIPERELTVYTLRENDTISKAVSSFRKKHPEVYIKQERGITDEASMTAEDAVRNLNTSLLSGEGPDIILLDGMPADSYVEKGMLADLTDFTEKIKKDNFYFENVLMAYKKQDGIYALPTRFQIPIMVAEKQTLLGIDSLEGLADAVTAEREKKPDQPTICGTYAPDELLAGIKPASVSAWVKDGEFQKDAVLEFFTQTEKIYQAEHKNITPEQEQLHEQTISQMTNFGVAGIRSYAEYMSLMSASQVYAVLGGEASIVMGRLNSMQSYEMLAGLVKTKESCDFAPLAGQVENVFCPVGVVGVSAQTKEEELSYDFLEHLFGTEVLQNDLGDGFPVNKTAFGEFSKNPNSDEYEVGFSVSAEDGSNHVTFTAKWPNEQEIARLEEMMESLTAPSAIEAMLEDAVMEIGEKVLNGQITPQEGADEVGQKMELYFAE